MELGKVICVPDHVAAAARDEAMAAAVGPEPSDVPALPGLDQGIIDPSAPHAGHLFIQPGVDGRLLDDVHGAGWRLVTIDPDTAAVDPSALDWFESIGGRLVPLARPDAVAGAWFADHDVTWALQRPDFYLYGAAANAADASGLLRGLRSRLGAVHEPVHGGVS